MNNNQRNNTDIRYFSFSKHLKSIFGEPVYKISVDAGFTCPNRDGTKGKGGCLYCSGEGSGAAYINKELSITKQLKNSIQQIKKKRKAQKFIAYFQPFSNTYAHVSHLRKLYDEALSINEIVGLSIGTRADIVDNDVLDLIEEYNEKTYLWIEYGLQSIHNKTLELINRCHSYKEFEDIYYKTKERNCRVCLHIIIGLPGESKAEILETANKIGELKPDGIKIHSLYISKNSPIAEDYIRGDISLFEADEYISITADFIERIPPNTIVQRLMGEEKKDKLIAPQWILEKSTIINKINGELEKRGTYQGYLYQKSD